MKKLICAAAIFITAIFLFAQSTEKIKIQMIRVPGKNYKISKTEVTQELYKSVMYENPSLNKGDKNPVENISWFDAVYFCNKLSEKYGLTSVYSVNGITDVAQWNYTPHEGKAIKGDLAQNTSVNGFRLPTEKEWEYAAKGGENFIYSGSDNLDEVGWYFNNSDDKTHPVAQKKANGYGLYDMSGNVWEWCWDTTKIGDSHYERGGGYYSYERFCKVSSRFYYNITDQYDNLGLRLVCSVVKKTSAAEKPVEVEEEKQPEEEKKQVIEEAEPPVEKAKQVTEETEPTVEEKEQPAEETELPVEKAKQVTEDADTSVEEIEKSMEVVEQSDELLENEKIGSQSYKDIESHMIKIPGKDFSMLNTEVTQGLYESVMGENPSYFKVGSEQYERLRKKPYELVEGWDEKKLPVECVSWYDAIYFCNKYSKMKGLSPVYSVNGKTDVSQWNYMPHKGNSITGKVKQNLTADGFRLPTEQEWKYAARGGEKYKYSGSDNLDEVGWYGDNSGCKTQPVAQKKANGYGLYDMSGNVWEWCWDVYPFSSGIRYNLGGSYINLDSSCEVSNRRDRYANRQDYYNIGFRIVCSVVSSSVSAEKPVEVEEVKQPVEEKKQEIEEAEPPVEKAKQVTEETEPTVEEKEQPAEETNQIKEEKKQSEKVSEHKNVDSQSYKDIESQMVKIPGKKFSMLRTEVTQGLYESVMGENPSGFKGENFPVECVSWYDAIYFCNKLSEQCGLTPVYSVDEKTDVSKWNYTPHKKESLSGDVKHNISANGFRLPGNEEWEYAAKGGQDFIYSGSDNLDEVGWYVDNSDDNTHPVAQKKANGYGLYDMSGNVCEWCWDVSPHYSYKRYYRGGSYYLLRDTNCEVSQRVYRLADYQYRNLGFRIVCSGSSSSSVAEKTVKEKEMKLLKKVTEMEEVGSEYYKDLEKQMVKIPGKKIFMLNTEVTQRLYVSVMGENPSGFKQEDSPVECVSWYDAIYFCNKLSEQCGLTPVYSVNGKTDVSKWDYTLHKGKIKGTLKQNTSANGFRLPTEKEWEYAAKGGEKYKYSGSDNLDEVGWYFGNTGGKGTRPVALKKPNGYGLYDMSGNVREWVWGFDRLYDFRRSSLGGGFVDDENNYYNSCRYDYVTVGSATLASASSVPLPSRNYL